MCAGGGGGEGGRAGTGGADHGVILIFVWLCCGFYYEVFPIESNLALWCHVLSPV